MNSRSFVIAAGAILLLSGCTTFQSLFGAPPPSGTACTTAICLADEMLTAAHDTHAAAATLLDQLVLSGVLHGTQAATAQSYLDQSEAILAQADAALAAGNAGVVSQDVAQATALVAQANTVAASIH